MQNLVEFILRCLLYPVSRQTETSRTVHQGGHNFLLDGGVVALGIDTVDQLLLQLHQLLTTGFILQQFLHQFFLLRVDALPDPGVKGEGPAHEGSLANWFVDGFLIEMHQQTELRDIETVDRRQHHGGDNQLLVAGIDGGRQQHLLHC